MEFMSDLQHGFDQHKPSLFELLSEQQLSSLIPPSLRYLLAVATHRHPRYLLRLLNSFDEVYALLMLAVERHYLRTTAGGCTENFYGLKRERVLAVKGGEVPRAQLGAPALVREALKLSETDIWKNLAVMVGLPYLKRKLDESYDIHAPQATLLGGAGQARDALPPHPTLKQRVLHYYKWFLRRVYPSVNAAYYFSLLAFNLAYLFDGTKYSSPFLWIIGTRIRRLGEVDHHAIARHEHSYRSSSSRPGAVGRPGQAASGVFNPRTLGANITPRLFSSMKILLPTAIFALKFLEWWHASDIARQLSRKAAEGLELPPPVISGLPSAPPPQSSPATNPLPWKQQQRKANPPPISSSTLLPILTVPAPSPATASSCPICLVSPPENPAACQTGFVFCYACIYRWLEGSHARQAAFMEGTGGGEEGWGEGEGAEGAGGSKEGRWESGAGRCAVTGRRVLGGKDGVRRLVV